MLVGARLGPAGEGDVEAYRRGEWKADMQGLGTVGEPVVPYVARGTYSLPVSLPAGQVRLDFAHPSGQVRLSIWAVPVRTFHTLYGSLVVLAALAVLLTAVKMWPRLPKRQPLSKKRTILYIVLSVVLVVLLGLLGLFVSLAVIMAIEAARGSSAARSQAAPGS
jgi:hypothetical protein